jgi:PAS domain-containing protein
MDRYRKTGQVAEPDSPTFRYYPDGGSGLSYDKTALWLVTLERHLGWETLQAIMSTFFERSRFGHPDPESFLAVVDEVSGRDMGWFFDQVYRDSVFFDYSIDSVHSEAIEVAGWVQRDGEMIRSTDDDDPTDYRTEVMVRRLGGGVFPVEILLTFDDGQRIRTQWSGEERSKLIAVEHPAKLVSAEVDPDRVLALDIDRTNNSRLLKPAARVPAVKWSSKWMIWFQDAMNTFAFFM